eukprot:5867179-Pyramimonas_sp.AAC.1
MSPVQHRSRAAAAEEPHSAEGSLTAATSPARTLEEPGLDRLFSRGASEDFYKGRGLAEEAENAAVLRTELVTLATEVGLVLRHPHSAKGELREKLAWRSRL